MITLSAVRKSYSTEVSIGPVDLQIPAGGVTALVGPNGAGKSTLLTMIGRLMGMDAKMAQYRDGAGFVNRVVHRVGHDGLAAVWTAPEQLPTPAEIAEPDAWVRRVHG